MSFKKNPPEFARKIVRSFGEYQRNYSIEGDMQEVYLIKNRKDSKRKADLW